MEELSQAGIRFAESSFPVAVAAFMLLRMEKELSGLRKAIERLRHCQTCRLSEDEDEHKDSGSK